nr:alcohol dehydrogenase catalytic domain-containing protein [Schaalia vaccimaxillae]
MLAARLAAIDNLTLQTQERPTPGPGEVLLKIESTTICGTDLRIVTGAKTQGVTKNVIMGHEIAARVESIGEGSTCPPVGTQVGLAPEYACYRCDTCQSGRSNICENMLLFGTTIDGGLAEYLLVPAPAVAAGSIVATSSPVDPRVLSLAEPLSCCLRAHRSFNIEPQSTVLVLGTGPIGLMHIALSQSGGARKIIACGRPSRLAPAVQMGAHHTTSASGQDLIDEVKALTSGRGADLVILAVGSTELAHAAPSMAAVGATISFFAGFSPRDQVVLDPNAIHYRELTVRGSANATVADYADAVRMISEGEVRLDSLITHTFPLEKVADAFHAQRTRQGLKVAVITDEESLR